MTGLRWFSKALCLCALDDSSRSIGNVISYTLLESVMLPAIHPKAIVPHSALPRRIQLTEGQMTEGR